MSSLMDFTLPTQEYIQYLPIYHAANYAYKDISLNRL